MLRVSCTNGDVMRRYQEKKKKERLILSATHGTAALSKEKKRGWRGTPNFKWKWSTL